MILFAILCLFLALFILIQQGKGDMGLGGLGRGGQALFGGSGGQDFFEKATWTMGALFMAGALGLTMFKARQTPSRLSTYKVPASAQKAAQQQVPASQEAPTQPTPDTEQK